MQAIKICAYGCKFFLLHLLLKSWWVTENEFIRIWGFQYAKIENGNLTIVYIDLGRSYPDNIILQLTDKQYSTIYMEYMCKQKCELTVFK